MAWSRRRFAIWACVLGTATLAVGIGATALAGKGLKTKSQTVNVGVQGANGSSTAKCAQGTKAVSGGFEGEFDPPPGPTPLFIMLESRRTGGREWTVSGRNQAGDAAGDLTSFAYCRDQKLKTGKSETVSVDPFEIGSATAKCKRGTKAFSGGFAAQGLDFKGETPDLFLTESRKQGKREWRVAAFNNGGEAGDLTAYVYCRKGKALKTKQADLDNYDRILDTNGEDDHGLYQHSGALDLHDSDSVDHEGSSGAIEANEYVEVGFTRDSDERIAGYANGVQQFAYTDLNPDENALIGSDGLLFFVDDPGAEMAPGAVARIRLFNRALSADQVRDVFEGCKVPKVKGKKKQAAKKKLKKAGCSVGKTKKKFSDKVEKGRVIKQKPKKGAERDFEFAVKLTISKGPGG